MIRTALRPAQGFLKHSLVELPQGKLPATTGVKRARQVELEQPEESAKRRATPEDAAGRKRGVSAKLARASRDLRDNRLTGIGLRPALGFLAVALILISFFAHGDGIALLPLLVGIAIMVALISAAAGKSRQRAPRDFGQASRSEPRVPEGSAMGGARARSALSRSARSPRRRDPPPRSGSPAHLRQ